MPHLEKYGKAPHGDADRYVDMRPARKEARLPNGNMSHSLYIIQSKKRLLKRIRPLGEKKLEKHEYRNSLSTPERRHICDWCDQGLYENPLHFF